MTLYMREEAYSNQKFIWIYTPEYKIKCTSNVKKGRKKRWKRKKEKKYECLTYKKKHI